MKKKSLELKIIFISLMISIIPIISFASEELILPEYTEEYKNWLTLSDEEKKEYIEPQAFKEITEESNSENSSAFRANTDSVGGSTLPSSYRVGYYGQVKNQNPYDACWAFSTATMFDSNYYVVNNSIKKTFSNFHMDYMTSNQYNPYGFNRKFNSGGNFQIAMAYATNGMGIALESEMPSMSGITSSQVFSVPQSAKVSDYIRISGTNELKKYINNYGAVPVYTYIGNNYKYFSSTNVNNNTDLAYCCTSEIRPKSCSNFNWLG